MASPGTALFAADYTILYRFAVALVGLNEEAEGLVDEVLENELGRILPTETSENRLIGLLGAVWKRKVLPRDDSPVRNLPPLFHRMSAESRAALALRGFGMENHFFQICGATPVQDDPAIPLEKISATLDSISVSPELINRLIRTTQAHRPTFRLFSAAGLTVLFSALALLGVGTWIWHDWAFGMDKDFAQKFVDAAERVNENSLEPVDSSAGELTDQLFLKYGLEHYSVPADFAEMRASLFGKDHVDGHPVVQIGFADTHAMLMVFRTEDFGLEPDEASWRTVQIKEWSLGLRSLNGQGNVLAVHGDLEALRAALPKKTRP